MMLLLVITGPAPARRSRVTASPRALEADPFVSAMGRRPPGWCTWLLQPPKNQLAEEICRRGARGFGYGG